MARDVSEKHDSLWWVAAPPGVWGAHFVLSYATAAVWCAKAGPDASLLVARVAIGAYTALALVAVGGVARRGFAQYRSLPREATKETEELDSPEVRHHFLGFTLIALSALSALAISFGAMAAVFIGSCR